MIVLSFAAIQSEFGTAVHAYNGLPKHQTGVRPLFWKTAVQGAGASVFQKSGLTPV
jgi:hypothetical protein